MRNSRFSMLVLLVAVPLAACQSQMDWLVVEAEVQELCIVDMATDFAGAPEGIVSQALGKDQLGIDLSEKFTASMFLRGFGVSPQNGVEKVDFIDSLRVQVSAAGQTPIELLNYISSEPSGDSLFVPSESSVDIAEYFELEDLELLVEFEGALPEAAWTANMEVCVSAHAAYRESF